MTHKGLAERLFSIQTVEAELADALDDIEFTSLGWDYYDVSLEMYGVPNNYRLSEHDQSIIHEMGFANVYVNHLDGWETHYSWTKVFKVNNGWRVKYRNKENPPVNQILLENKAESWPDKWYDADYVKIIDKGKEDGKTSS
jgi:hypothetical protein